jgi:penicillin-binding protein 2
VPARGLIYDRNGRLLADNVPAYRLELVPEQVADLDATLRALAAVLPLSRGRPGALPRPPGPRQRRFQPVPLKFRLSEAEVARFAVNRHRFPGVEVVPYLTRRYPYGELFGHVVGYVGRIDVADRAAIGDGRYAAPPTSASRASSATTRTACTARSASSTSRSMPRAAPCACSSARRRRPASTCT